MGRGCLSLYIVDLLKGGEKVGGMCTLSAHFLDFSDPSLNEAFDKTITKFSYFSMGHFQVCIESIVFAQPDF